MNEMIQRLIEKTGLSEEQASTAVDTVVQFLKEKMPPQLASQLDSLTGNSDGSSESMVGKLGSMGASLGGMFGKRE